MHWLARPNVMHNPISMITFMDFQTYYYLNQLKKIFISSI